MSFFSFLTGVGSLFADPNKKESKSSTSTNQDIEQAVTGKTDQTSSITGTTTGNTNTTQTNTSSQTGTSTGTSTSSATGKTTNYSADVMASLDSMLKQQMAAGGVTASTDALKGRLDQVKAMAANEFDVEGYVSGITSAAAAATNSDLEDRINTTLSAVGGSETGNSMAALLGNRMRNDAAANLAGVASSAYAQGEAIRDQQRTSVTAQMSQLAGDMNASLTALLGAAKGGTQTTTESGKTTQQQSDKTAGTSKTGTKTDSKQTEKQTGKTSTSETGVTQTKSKTDSKTSSKSKKGDLFSNIIGKLTDSSKAA